MGTFDVLCDDAGDGIEPNLPLLKRDGRKEIFFIVDELKGEGHAMAIGEGLNPLHTGPSSSPEVYLSRRFIPIDAASGMLKIEETT